MRALLPWTAGCRQDGFRHLVFSAIGLCWLFGSGLQEPLLAFQPAGTERTRSLITQENLKPGSTDWQLTRVRPDGKGFRSPWIEGYCSKQSVRAGESIDIMVSTDPPRKFQVEIFRMGYYGGQGARLLRTIGPLKGLAQQVPEPGRQEHARVQVEAKPSAVTIPADWLSGVYLGRLTTLVDPATEPYWQSYVVFIVRDERPADILFQCSDNTWQAYNRWPDQLLALHRPQGSQGPWADVSFDRPYGQECSTTQILRQPAVDRLGRVLCSSSFRSPTGSNSTATM